MENEEIIQAFEDFIGDQVRNNTYTISKYNLKENLTGKVLVEARAGGSSGGNCWNNNPSVPYSADSEDIKSEIIDELVGKFNYLFDTIEQSKSNLNNVAAGIAEQIYDSPHTDDFENEYYGNYTRRNLYLVDMESFLEKTLDTDNFELFKTALNNVKGLEDPIYLQNSLTERQQELTKQLATFDADKAKDKARIKHDLDRYQKVYDEFDGHVASIKSGLEKELKKVEKELNPTKPKKLKR